jgi:MFS family permease
MIGSVERSLDRLRRQPGYARLYAAATLGRLSNEMVSVAVVLYVLDRTGSASVAGATVAAVTLPSLISGPLLGGVIDRTRRRRRWLALDQAVMCAGLVGIAATAGSGPDWVVPLIALVAGITFPLSAGGFTSLITAFVPDELLTRANALEATSFNLAVIAGPALAGLVATASDPLTALLLQLGLKLGALLFTVRIRETPGGASAGGGQPLAGLVVAGFRHVLGTPSLLAITTAGAVSMLGRGLLTIAFPLFAVDVLGARGGFAGFLWAAFAGGAVTGTLALMRVQHRWASERVVLRAVGLAGVLMLTWPLATAPPVALALVATAGFVYGPGLAATFAVRQDWTPPELQGQVFMTAASLKVGSFALGAALAGLLAPDLGAREILLLAAGAQLAGFVLGAALMRGGTRRRAVVSEPYG